MDFSLLVFNVDNAIYSVLWMVESKIGYEVRTMMMSAA